MSQVTAPSNVAAPSFPAAAPVAPTVEQMQVRVNHAVNTGNDFIKKRDKARDVRRNLFRDILALEYEYKAADGSRQKEFDKIVDARCEHLKYTNNARTTFAHKVAKLALNNNPKDVNALVHVISVAFAHNVPAKDAIEWLKDKGGFQAVRISYCQDGAPKNAQNTGDDNDTSTNNGTYPVEMPEITFVKEKLSNAALGQAVVDPQLLEDFADVTEDTECAVIATYHPNGTMTIRAVVKDVEATYDSYFRAKYPNGIPASKAQVQALIDKEKITTEEFRLIVGAEGVDQCNDFWAYVKDRKDWLTDLPPDLIAYKTRLGTADKMPEDKGIELYEDAIEQLLEAMETQPHLCGYLDRDVSAKGMIERDTMPRLITSKSSYNQAKSDDANLTKQDAMRMQLMRLLTTLKD